MKRLFYDRFLAIIPLLMSIISLAFAEIPQPQEPPNDSVFYYILNETEGVSIVEIWGTPDPEIMEEYGYEEVTIEDIHNAGYLTPSESEVEADKNGDIDSGDEEGCGYSSWINTGYSGNNKKIEAGSSTTRSPFPGSLAISCTLYVYSYQQGYIPFNWHPINGGWYTTWGWKTYKSFTHTYSTSTTWKQRGHHHWGDQYNQKTSQVIKSH
jgi:hypothetical protein